MRIVLSGDKINVFLSLCPSGCSGCPVCNFTGQLSQSCVKAALFCRFYKMIYVFLG